MSTKTNTVKATKTKYKGKNRNVFVIVVLTVLIIYSFTLMFTLFWGAVITLKSQSDFMLDRVSLPNFSRWNGKSIFSNYIAAWNNMEWRPLDPMPSYLTVMNKTGVKRLYIYSVSNMSYLTYQNGQEVYITFIDGLLNSAFYCTSMALVVAFGPLIPGYVCAKFNFKLAGIMYGFVIFTMSTPIIGTGATLINFIKLHGLYGEIWGEWIKNLGWTNMWFLIYYAHFKTLSNTYSEAAEIDGASQFRILFQISFPLCKTIFTTIFLMAFVGKWSDYNTPLLYLPSYPTVALLTLYASNEGTRPEQIAACMYLAIPAILLFLIFKNQLMGNLTLGGLKE